MARLSLSKSSLSRQSRQLKTYERFLPSLEMKHRQLMAERVKAHGRLAQTDRTIAELRQRVGEKLPMLSNHEVELEELVRIRTVRLGRENLVGTRLPVLQGIDVQVRDYGLVAKPHWVDRVVIELTRMLELHTGRQVELRRLELLNTAVRKVTQRVNLFEKVLIPRTRDNIRRIRITLSDAERAAVVRSKIAKGKRSGVDQGKQVTVIVPRTLVGLEDLRHDPLRLHAGGMTHFVLNVAGDVLDEGISIGVAEDDDQHGIRLYLEDKQVHIDLTDKAVAELLLTHLQPRFRAVLEGTIK